MPSVAASSSPTRSTSRWRRWRSSTTQLTTTYGDAPAARRPKSPSRRGRGSSCRPRGSPRCCAAARTSGSPSRATPPPRRRARASPLRSQAAERRADQVRHGDGRAAPTTNDTTGTGRDQPVAGRRRPRPRTPASRRARRRRRRRAGTGRRAGCGTRPGSSRRRPTASPRRSRPGPRVACGCSRPASIARPKPRSRCRSPADGRGTPAAPATPAARRGRSSRRAARRHHDARSTQGTRRVRRQCAGGDGRCRAARRSWRVIRRDRRRPAATAAPTCSMYSTMRGPHREAMSSSIGITLPLTTARDRRPSRAGGDRLGRLAAVLRAGEEDQVRDRRTR